MCFFSPARCPMFPCRIRAPCPQTGGCWPRCPRPLALRRGIPAPWPRGSEWHGGWRWPWSSSCFRLWWREPVYFASHQTTCGKNQRRELSGINSGKRRNKPKDDFFWHSEKAKCWHFLKWFSENMHPCRTYVVINKYSMFFVQVVFN